MKKICFTPGNVMFFDYSKKNGLNKDSFIVDLFKNILISQNDAIALRVYYFDTYNPRKVKTFYKNSNISFLLRDIYLNEYVLLFVDELNTLAKKEGGNFRILTNSTFNIEVSGKISEESLNSLEKLDSKYKNFISLCEKIEERSNIWYLYPINLRYNGANYLIGFIFYNNDDKFSKNNTVFNYYKNLLLITGINSEDVSKEFLLLLKLAFSRIFSRYTHIKNTIFEFNSDFETTYSISFNNYNIEKYEEMFVIDHGDITTGFELEFECLEKDTGYVVSAFEVLKQYYYYDYEEDEIPYNNEILDRFLEKRIGVDGHSIVGECRSNYYLYNEIEKQIKEFENLVKSVCNIVYDSEVKRRFNNVGVNFIGYRNALGFHYHIGFERDVYNMTRFNKRNLVMMFDIVLGILLRELNSEVRINSHYSNLSNTENKSYGFEYRTLSSAIVYNDLYKDVLTIASRMLHEYFVNNYLEVELDKEFNVSHNFYRKHVEDYSAFMKRIFKTIKLINGNYLSTYKNGNVNIMNLTNDRSTFDSSLFKLLLELNDYTKNCWIYPFGLRRSRGDFSHNIVGVENCIPDYNELNFPFAERKIKILDKTYYHIPLGLSHRIRTINYQNPSDEDQQYIEYLVYLLTKFLEKLNERSLLKIKPEKIMDKLEKKYPFLRVAVEVWTIILYYSSSSFFISKWR